MKRVFFTIICTALIAVLNLFSLHTFASSGVKPGLNVFTGTEKAYDFEGDTSDVVFHTPTSEKAEVYADDNGKTVNSVVVREKDGNDSNHAAAVDGNCYYFYIDCDFPVIDKKRPVKVSYDYILGLKGNQVRTLINYPTKHKASQREAASFYIAYHSPAMTAETWRSVTHEYTSEGAYIKSGKTYYNGSEDMEFLSFINYSGKAQASYFDNLLCVPYYKVSYNLNGGKGVADDEYFLQDSGTVYTLLNTGADIFKNGYAFKGWAKTADALPEDVITDVTVTPGEDITLYAVWQQDETVVDKYLVELYDGEKLRSTHVITAGKALTLPGGEYTDSEFLLGWKTSDGGTVYGARIVPVSDIKLYSSFGKREVKPGVNVFENGDFEQDGIIDLRPSNGVVEMVEENGNSFIKYTRNSGHASLQHAINWEGGRKYKISYKAKTPADTSVCANLVYTDTDGTTAHIYQKNISKDNWLKHELTYTFPENSDTFTFTPANSDALSLYANPMANVDNVVYYDDVSIVPYYKVTYNAAGGEGTLPKDEYFLDGTYTVDTQTTLTKEGYNFVGWTLKEGGINLVSQVTPIPGKDIILYAAWENPKEAEAITYTFDNDKKGIANGSITIELNDETASYTSAQILLANDEGVLDEYTPFGEVVFSDGEATYAVTGNRAFPVGATRLAVRFMAEGLDDIYYWYKIPQEKRLTVSNSPLYSFWAVSDTHLGGSNYNTDYMNEMTVNRNNAFNDIFSSDADFVFINGDVVNYGTTPYLNVLQSYLDDRLNNSSYNTKNMPVFLTNGNHEYFNTQNQFYGFDYDAIINTFGGQLDYLEKTFGDDVVITRYLDEEMWYAVDIKDAKFIFLSSPQASEDKTYGGSYSYSEEQLMFLDEQLYDGEKSGKTSYLVSHVPLQNTIVKNSDGEFESGITNTDEVNAILEKHPNVIVFSGHTHSDLSVDEGHFTVVGNMTTSPSHINDGCSVWIDSWEGKGDLDENGEHTRFKKGFSSGVYVEVYEDIILVKSRKFLSESLYFGHGVYVIELPSDTNAKDKTVTFTGKAQDGETFTAYVDGKVPSEDDGYTYEWIVGGKVVGTQSKYTAAVKRYFDGKHIALRVTFPDGSYASALSEDVFEFPFADDYITDAQMTIGEDTEYDTYFADFGKYVGECTFVAAAYNEDNVLVGTDIIILCDDDDGVAVVKVAKELESNKVKVFAFDSMNTLKVVCKEAVAYGNLIENGNAQGDNTEAFFSENGTVSIVDDAEKGKVWKVVPLSSTKYCYIQQNFDYIPGATYKMKMDVKILEANGSTDITGVINSNTRYRIDGETSRDHIQSRTTLKAGEWKTVEYTFTVSETATPNASDEFAIYSNPVKIDGTEYGVTYCVTNVEVQLYSLGR